MSDFQHTSTFQFETQTKPFQSFVLILVLCLIWVCITLTGFVFVGFSDSLTQRLALDSRHPKLRLHQSQLAVTRGLLQPELGSEQIWSARASGSSVQFFHAAAAHSELLGNNDATRLFLAMQALERGDRKTCNQWAAATPYARLMDREMQPAEFAGATWLTQKPWTDLMHHALVEPESPLPETTQP